MEGEGLSKFSTGKEKLSPSLICLSGPIYKLSEEKCPSYLERRQALVTGIEASLKNNRGLEATNPGILLFDEPTSALDPIATRFIKEKIGEFNEEIMDDKNDHLWH